MQVRPRLVSDRDGERTMKRIGLLGICVVLLFGCVSASAQDAPQPKLLGILPVFDTSGEEYGQMFVENMTQMLYERLRNEPFSVLVLNPGRLYNPLIPESIVEYAQSSGADT